MFELRRKSWIKGDTHRPSPLSDFAFINLVEHYVWKAEWRKKVLAEMEEFKLWLPSEVREEYERKREEAFEQIEEKLFEMLEKAERKTEEEKLTPSLTRFIKVLRECGIVASQSKLVKAYRMLFQN